MSLKSPRSAFLSSAESSAIKILGGIHLVSKACYERVRIIWQLTNYRKQGRQRHTVESVSLYGVFPLHFSLIATLDEHLRDVELIVGGELCEEQESGANLFVPASERRPAASRFPIQFFCLFRIRNMAMCGRTCS